MDGATDTMQLMLVIGDGRFGDKRNSMKQWLHKAQEQNIFVVFIIVDANQKESILDIQSISNIKGQMIMKPYMDEFPFTFYMVLKNISTLSSVLGDALRQWIEMVAK
jgi:midasin